ncbi:MAG: AAA family ATPase [Methanobacteriota archaeon]
MVVHGRNGFTPTQAKIVSHLAPFARLANSYLQPDLVTQDGIARSVGIARNHVPHAINDLIANDYVTSRKARVDGAARRKTCYFLTEGGLQSSKEPAELPARRKKPSRDRGRFVGRRRELKELASWLKGGAPVLVLEGERGMGKTALLRRFQERTEKRHVFCWSLTNDGTLRDGLISLADGLPDGQGRMLAYMVKTEPGINHCRAVGMLDEIDKPLVLVLDDADRPGAKADAEAMAGAFAKARKARLLLAGERFELHCRPSRIRLDGLSRAETEKLAKMLGRGDPAEAYESSGGRPWLVEMWSPATKGASAISSAPVQPMSKKEARALEMLMLFGRPVHLGEAAALGFDYQVISWLAGKRCVTIANGRIHPLGRGSVSPRKNERGRNRGGARVARAILATWNDPTHDAEACAHYLDAGDDAACGKVVAEKGERMLKAGFAPRLDEILSGLKTERLDAHAHARVLTVMGAMKKMRGEWEGALVCFEKARHLGGGDDAYWAESTARIASVYLARRDLARALKTYGEALVRLPRGQPRIEARIRDEIATALLRNGDADGASASSDIAVARAGETGDAELVGLCEATRGNVFAARGDFAEAERCFSEALAKVRAVSNVRAEGTILINLAGIQQRMGNIGAAAAMWKDSAALLERHGDPRYCMALANLATALWRTGDWVGSRECRAKALSLARIVNEKAVEGAMLTVEGNEEMLSGRIEDAVRSYRGALDIKNALPDMRARVRARCDVANALVSAKRPGEALEVLKSDVDWAKSAGCSEEAAGALLSAARAELAGGNGAGARGLLKSALSACAAGDRPSSARVLRTLGVCAAVDGEWYVAKRYLDDALAMFKESGEAVEYATTLHDIARAFKLLGLDGADAAMEAASESAKKIGMAFPPLNSDWLLAANPA